MQPRCMSVRTGRAKGPMLRDTFPSIDVTESRLNSLRKRDVATFREKFTAGGRMPIRRKLYAREDALIVSERVN